MLTLTLLGPFRAEVEGRDEALRLPTQKAVALLAYLALNHDGPLSRDALARLLWNDVPLKQGRHSLRQELTHIRRALGTNAKSYVQADRSTVSLRHEAIAVDAERLVELVTRHTSDSMREACELYHGELLKGLHTRERQFDGWLDGARRNLSRLAIIALEFRLDELTRPGPDGLAKMADASEALKVARQLFTIDPENDTPYRRMMTLYGTADEPQEPPTTASSLSVERRKDSSGALENRKRIDVDRESAPGVWHLLQAPSSAPDACPRGAFPSGRTARGARRAAVPSGAGAGPRTMRLCADWRPMACANSPARSIASSNVRPRTTALTMATAADIACRGGTRSRARRTPA